MGAETIWISTMAGHLALSTQGGFLRKGKQGGAQVRGQPPWGSTLALLIMNCMALMESRGQVLYTQGQYILLSRIPEKFSNVLSTVPSIRSNLP